MDAKILSRVRKLLAKAEDAASTEAESKALTEKAHQLMAAHGIEQAMLGQHDPASDPVTSARIDYEAPYAAEKAMLLHRVASTTDCTTVRTTGRGSGRFCYSMVYGHRSDLERVELLFTSLLLQSVRLMKAQAVPRYDHPRAYRRTWLRGFADEIGQRMTAARKRAIDDAPSTGAELVLASRQQAADDAMATAHPHTRKVRTTYTGSGYGAGRKAGRHADVGASRLTSRKELTR